LDAKSFSDMIGRQITDVYGRPVGRIAGVTVGYGGEIESLAVDSGDKFVQYLADELSEGEDGPQILPSWVVEFKASGIDASAIQKRLVALETMKRMKGVSQPIYEELRTKLADAQETHRTMSGQLRERLETLAMIDASVDSFLAMVRLQLMSDELDEGTFKASADYCAQVKSMNDKERAEIEVVIGPLPPAEEATEQVGEAPASVPMEKVSAPEPEPLVEEPRRAEAMHAQKEPVEEVEEPLPEQSKPTSGGLRSLRNRPVQ